MTLFTPNYSFPFPELSDIPNEPTQVEALAIAIDSQLAVTDGNVTANATRAALLAALLGTSAVRYTNFTAAQTVNDTVGASTPYVNLTTGASTLCGHTFVAPPSGIVKVTWGLNGSTSIASGSTLFVGSNVAQGASLGLGTTQSAASNDEAIQITGTNNVPGQRSRPVTGLTPGSIYNVWIQWRNSGAATGHGFLPFVMTESMLA